MSYPFSSLHLKKCKWSKDPRKKYNQCKHFINNNKKYNLSINDMLYLGMLKDDCYKKIKKKG